MGMKVVVVEASTHVGGMTTGGLSSSDVGKAWSIGGLASQFYSRVGKAYGSDDRIFHFEPKVAAAVFGEWLREAGVEVITGEPLNLADGVVKKDGRIESIRSISGRVFRGRMFIDASFEGDLMAKSGTSFTVGREPESQYGESLAGIRRGDRKPRPHYTQGDKDHFTPAVDPYVKPGDPASGLDEDYARQHDPGATCHAGGIMVQHSAPVLHHGATCCNTAHQCRMRRA
jgi:hypothetical protein